MWNTKNVIIPDLDNDLNVIDPPIILYLRIESKIHKLHTSISVIIIKKNNQTRIAHLDIILILYSVYGWN